MNTSTIKTIFFIVLLLFFSAVAEYLKARASFSINEVSGIGFGKYVAAHEKCHQLYVKQKSGMYATQQKI